MYGLSFSVYVCIEGIALIKIAGGIAFSEPLLTLGSGTVGESIRNNSSLVFLHQDVISYRSGSVHSFFNIARLEGFEHLLVVVSPHPCQEISLQFKPDKEFVCIYLAHP